MRFSLGGPEGQKAAPACLSPLSPRGRGVGGEGALVTRHRDRAKELRHNQTEAEAFVWAQLRSRRFSGFKFRRQMPLRKYIVDFVCLDRRVIVELDGGQHNEDKQMAYDGRRDGWLRAEGFEILDSGTMTCFWNGRRWLRIWHTLQSRPSKRRPAPSPPTPLPRGERGEVEGSREA